MPKTSSIVAVNNGGLKARTAELYVRFVGAGAVTAALALLGPLDTAPRIDPTAEHAAMATVYTLTKGAPRPRAEHMVHAAAALTACLPRVLDGRALAVRNNPNDNLLFGAPNNA